MPSIFFLPEASCAFPAPSQLVNEDLAVIGSNLEPQTLVAAYKKGYFPWYNPGQPRCWFHPDPRMVLLPSELIVSKSMRQVLRSPKFEFRVNTDFTSVINSCRMIDRGYGEGISWISPEIIESYTRLFQTGIAHCAETWHDGKLVGGLYGLKIGDIFFGESMFAAEPNASKFAFIHFVRALQEDGIRLIDCQQETSHMASLGARPVSRRVFCSWLEKFIPENDNVW